MRADQTPERVAIYADKDEYWPWWDLSTDKNEWTAGRGPAGEIPVELWRRYQEASRAYWAAKNEILDLLGLRGES